MPDEPDHVVIVGGGFGGLEVARRLARTALRITLIDQRNHHLFQPLLYQVATASLTTSEIAWPIRSLLRDHANITTLLGKVVGVDTENKRVLLEDGGSVAFDTLVLATGARHSYFGHDEWEPFAPSLKTIEDATAIRRRILSAFEKAERTTDAAERVPYQTFVVIGGGPTGVELAGTIAELARETLRGEFRNIDTSDARVILVEAGTRILAGFRESLSEYAYKALSKLGVDIRLGHPVTECTREGVKIADVFVPAKTIIWAAGVAASPVAEWLEAAADGAGRIKVEPDLSVPGHPDIFAIGDTASVVMPNGRLVPGIAPAAKQEGQYVGDIIRARLAGRAAPPPFRYKDTGSLATIGKRAAVVDFGWVKLTGRFAWWLWGFAHIYFLIGMRHRLAVALNWLWIYFTGQRSARLITQGQDVRGSRPD
ncbi:NAD(P)/FAD-dependent oxidoreductase [Mesorhizobium sp. GR13]|uniref:NAD(P)/FAD-dependent oxidoreductase n=1 Tax=Mesorhizobium sp. GR13 TaxID=2562308 RepID=UPI0010BFF084|nr:NAD(P)/FAD-dependent oxidoreductase [Mesorhizobium sp. GR13]